MKRARSLAMLLLCGAAPPIPAVWADAEALVTTPLRGVIQTPNPRVASTLVRKGYPLTPEGVRRVLQSPDQTAQLAAMVLVSVQVRAWSDALKLCQQQLGGPAPIALEAAATLVESGDQTQKQAGMQALNKALEDGSWRDVQLNAAAYLARAGDPAGLPVLLSALKSPEEALRLQAVLLLGAFATFEGTPKGQNLSRLALLSAALQGPDPSVLVRREAVYQLAALPQSAQRDSALKRVAQRDPDAQVRLAASNRLPKP